MFNVNPKEAQMSLPGLSAGGAQPDLYPYDVIRRIDARDQALGITIDRCIV
jgi:hypothetical protein